MSRRWSQSWCWGAVLLTMLGPALALACLPPTPASWKMTSQDGRFELSVELGERPRSGPYPLTLRDVRAKKVLWQRSLEDFAQQGQVLISPSGRYVALTNPFSPTLVLFGPDGTERRSSLEEQLKKSELRKIPYTSCGSQWLGERHFEGDTLVVNVLTGGVRPPMYEQPKGTLMRLDATSGQLTREAPPPGDSTAKLIQAYKGACDSCNRSELAQQLVGRSADAGIGGDTELSRFWQDVLSTPQQPPQLDTLAVEGLSLVATDEELRQVARRPSGSPERNQSLHSVLTQRLPDEAETYSLRLLSERWPSEVLRAIAVGFLTRRESTVASRALTLGLSDPSAKVREHTLYEVGNRPVSAETVEQVLSFCKDPDADVRKRVVESLHRMLRDVGQKEGRQAIYELFGRAGSDGRLKCFPEGWLVLGAVADVQKNRARALELYTQGLKELSALEEDRRNVFRDLVLEAKLQLAFEAKKQGKQAEVERRAREIIEDPRNRFEYVCAPLPNSYGGSLNETGCRGRSTADDTAQNLLKEVTGGDKK